MRRQRSSATTVRRRQGELLVSDGPFAETRRLARYPEATVSYREALRLARTDAERRYLRRRLAEAAAHG